MLKDTRIIIWTNALVLYMIQRPDDGFENAKLFADKALEGAIEKYNSNNSI